jgi:hypothetical protein
MGIHNQGILGGFSGKVGKVIGSNWKGKEVMRGLPRINKNRVPSEKQAIQQAKFALVSGFIMPFVGLLNETFKDYAKDMTAFNSASQYTLAKALTGTYPDFALDYSRCLLAKGPLHNAAAPTSNSTVAGEIAFSWVDNSGFNNALATDTSILMAYCEELNQAIYFRPGPARSAAAAILAMPGYSGKTFHTWLSFISEKGELATSTYTGAVIVA